MKSKFFRVATSGPTIDGREITPEQINQMAESYDPKVYGARINVEHLVSRAAGQEVPFACVGDVVALKAEDDERGNRVLLAQIDPKPELVKLSQDRQKVYWSIEMHPDFQGTGKAYLCGLAVTDTPASTGTDMIRFTTSAIKGHMVSAPVEGTAIEDEAGQSVDTGFFAALARALGSGAVPAEQPKPDADKKPDQVDARFAQIEGAIAVLAHSLGAINSTLGKLSTGQVPAPAVDQATQQPLSAQQPQQPLSAQQPQQPAPDAPVTQAQFAALIQQLSSTPATPGRTPHDGTAAGTGNVTDC